MNAGRVLVEQYSNSIKGIGFSSHYDGVELDGAAFVLGADYIERHFTLDKNCTRVFSGTGLN